MTINSSSRVPKHVQASILLKRRIEKGDYHPGSKFPPVRMLGAELGVSLNVIQRAVQLLEKEGVVESQHGIGVRVLANDRHRRTPLTFGLVYPFPPDSPFAGTIHVLAEKAIDLQNNHCIIKSSGGSPSEEQETIEQCLESGVEGLLVWPCPGEENIEFFQTISERTPVVFIDRTFEALAVAGVTLDWVRAGREIVQFLSQRGYRRVLILEEPLPISSFRQLYTAMRETVRAIRGEGRFALAALDMNRFLDLYPADPRGAVDQYVRQLEDLLAADQFEALFCPYDEFIDWVYTSGPLRSRFSLRQIVSLSNTRPTPRSLAFYDLGVREWIGDYGAMIRKATDILHDKVYLKSRSQNQVRIPFYPVVRTNDRSADRAER